MFQVRLVHGGRSLQFALFFYVLLVGVADAEEDVCNMRDSCEHKSHALLQIASTSSKSRVKQTIDAPDLLEDSRIVSNIQTWVRDYGAGLEATRERARAFVELGKRQLLNEGGRAWASTGDEEAAIHYLRIRATKPKITWECSPANGYSSIFILSAIADNHNGGHLHSFGLDPAEKVLQNIREVDPSLLQYWTYHEGDFRLTVNDTFTKGSIESLPLPNYVYLDADHSSNFAQFYTSQFLSKLPGHTYVSIHDIYKWTGYGGDPHEPTEEGKVVFDFLKQKMLSPCNIFTVSGYHKPDLLESVRTNLEPFCCKDRLHEGFANPTIWFQLQC